MRRTWQKTKPNKTDNTWERRFVSITRCSDVPKKGRLHTARNACKHIVFSNCCYHDNCCLELQHIQRTDSSNVQLHFHVNVLGNHHIFQKWSLLAFVNDELTDSSDDTLYSPNVHNNPCRQMHNRKHTHRTERVLEKRCALDTIKKTKKKIQKKTKFNINFFIHSISSDAWVLHLHVCTQS